MTEKMLNSLRPILYSLWGETVNRMDTLLLEIRHVQFNIIRDLRENGLYSVLKYEEPYLWGKYIKTGTSGKNNPEESWFNYLNEQGVTDLERLVNCWIVKLTPQPITCNTVRWTKLKSDFKSYFNIPEFVKACTIASRIYSNRDVGRGYGPAKTQLYMALAALQTLKANILRDKLILCYWANKAAKSRVTISAGKNGVQKQDRLAIGRFIMARSGVMLRMGDYIERVEDLRLPHERSIDLSIMDDAKPISTRRREQGAYSEYLSQRSLRYHSSIKLVLRETTDFDEETDVEAYINHRWSHDSKSCYAYFPDETIPPKSEAEEFEDRSLKQHHYLNTSFWMVDRPDLQPIIAHEAAHLFMKKLFGDVGEAELKHSRGCFGELFRSLSKDFFYHQNPDYQDKEYPLDNLQILQEIGADLIASSRNPMSYLWALFLEIIGLDLHRSLETPKSECDLTKIEEAEKSGYLLQFESQGLFDNRLWSVRLHSVCTWVEAIDEQSRNNPLAQYLRDCIRLLTNITVEYLEETTPLQIMKGRGIVFLEKFTSVICKNIQGSAAARTVSVLQKKIKYETMAVDVGGSKTEYNAELGLPLEYRCRVFEWLYDLKQMRFDKRLPERIACEDYWSLVIPQYFQDEDKHIVASNVQDFVKQYDLFFSVNDIPWCAYILRGVDLTLSSDDAFLKHSVYQQLFEDFDPGNDFHLLSHEVAAWLRSNPRRRLARVLRVIGDVLKNISEAFGKVEPHVEVCQLRLDFAKYWFDAYCKRQFSTPFQESCNRIFDEVLPDLFHWITGCSVSPENIDTAIEFSQLLAAYGDIYKDDATTKPIVSKSKSSELNVLQIIRKEQNSTDPDEMELRQKIPTEKLRCLRNILKSYLKKYDDDFLVAFTCFDELLTYLDVCSSSLDVTEIRSGLSEIANQLSLTASTKEIFPSAILKMALVAQGVSNSTHQMHYNHLNWSGTIISAYQSVLGRHDILAFCTPSYHNKLPVPDLAKARSGDYQEPFSLRSEQTIPIPFNDSTKEKSVFASNQFIAMMSITLTGRDSRLDFYLALRNAITETKKKPKCGLVHAAHRIDPDQDVFLLSEGGADIILLFFGDIENRLLDILKIQKFIRQYFLVEQTETIFSPNALNIVGRDLEKRFSLSLQMRLKSDRNLNATIEFVERRLSDIKLLKKYGLAWSRLPGRLDYELFIPPERAASILNDSHGMLNDRLERGALENPLNMLLPLCGLFADPPRRRLSMDYLVDEVISTIGLRL